MYDHLFRGIQETCYPLTVDSIRLLLMLKTIADFF